ncbi:MAG: hypothetical protein HYR76_06580 [Ignavibacteria bacterium]|nr:hypothetical protein [Ignavibacteria bacterium]MBI3765798.1 hypothetical protein [Ignavibacteriales bacterium]
MAAKTLSLILFFMISVIAVAGEKQPMHLTGNPTVDFFGISSRSLAFSDTNRMTNNQELVPASDDQTKSPWIAGILSLAIPGSGEVYSGSYVKGAIFFVADVAFWTTAHLYDKKGDHQTDVFQDFANAHWNAVRYANWTLENLNTINPGVPQSNENSYRMGIYGTTNTVDPNTCGPPFGCINWVALNNMERDVANNGYTHSLPYYNQQQYYELIGKYDQFSRGWDDADLTDITMPIKRNSKRMTEYSEMRAQANNYYDVASTFVSVAVINHFLSAIDAFWSATRYNKSLHAELKMRMQPTSVGLLPMTEARIRYDF